MERVKFEQIDSILQEDLERAKYLLGLSPIEAVAEFKKYGIDLTEAEVIEAGEEIKKTAIAVSKNELGEEELENVAGGSRAFGYGLFTGTVGGAVLLVVAVSCGW